MQTISFASVHLLLCAFASGILIRPAHAQAKPPKMASPPRLHAVSLGAVRRVPFTPADTTAQDRSEDATTLRIRPLIVDERQREWTVGEIHEVTDRTFAIRRALHVNDALPAEHEPRWSWEPGPWLLVDRVTGRVTALHLPAFDSVVSDAVWFRDYAAYCGITSTAKGSSLSAVVAQLGARRAIVQRSIGVWPQAGHFIPVCQPAQWQRLPLRVTLQPTGGSPATYAVLGSTSLVEDNEDSEP